jgi:hypothetical protein
MKLIKSNYMKKILALKMTCFVGLLFSFLNLPAQEKVSLDIERPMVSRLKKGFLVFGISKSKSDLFVAKRYDDQLKEVGHYEKNVPDVKSHGSQVCLDEKGNYAFYIPVSMKKSYSVTLDTTLKELQFGFYDSGKSEKNPALELIQKNGGATGLVGTYDSYRSSLYGENGNFLYFCSPVYSPERNGKMLSEVHFNCEDKSGKLKYETSLTSSAKELFAPSDAYYDFSNKQVLLVGNYGTLSEELIQKNFKGWTREATLYMEFEGVAFVLIGLTDGKIIKRTDLKFDEVRGMQTTGKPTGFYLGAAIEKDEAGRYYIVGENFASPRIYTGQTGHGDGAPMGKAKIGPESEVDSEFLGFTYFVLDKNMTVSSSTYYRMNDRKLENNPVKFVMTMRYSSLLMPDIRTNSYIYYDGFTEPAVHYNPYLVSSLKEEHQLIFQNPLKKSLGIYSLNLMDGTCERKAEIIQNTTGYFTTYFKGTKIYFKVYDDKEVKSMVIEKLNYSVK